MTRSAPHHASINNALNAPSACDCEHNMRFLHAECHVDSPKTRLNHSRECEENIAVDIIHNFQVQVIHSEAHSAAQEVTQRALSNQASMSYIEQQASQGWLR